MTAHTSIVVIGGGYAGVLAANRLQAHPDVTVTLINPRPEFVERIRLHQLAAGSEQSRRVAAGRQGPPRVGQAIVRMVQPGDHGPPEATA